MTSKLMTYETYRDIPLGENIASIQMEVGRPYEVREVAPHTQEYVFVERIFLGDGRELFRRYILTVQNGKVVDKQVKEETTSELQFHGN